MTLRSPSIALVLLISLLASELVAGVVRAGEANVVAAEAVPEGPGLWRFNVTVRHGDEGWDHYADQWEVLGPDGTVLGARVLQHPHETEQPFTRSLGGVAIPAGVTSVIIRAHDKLQGYDGAELSVTLPER